MKSGGRLFGGIVAAIGATVAAAACGSATGPAPRGDEPIQTDRLSYEMVRDTLVIMGEEFPNLGTTVDYTFTNRTGATVYIVRCNDPAVLVERLGADGAWALFWGTGSEDCLSPPIVIEPGERYEGSFDFWGVESGVEGFEPSFPAADLEGTYRMLLPDVIHLDDPADYPDGTPVEPSERRSNAFDVVVR